MVKDAEAHAEDDRRQRELVEARNTAENAAYQAERQLASMGDTVDCVLEGGDRGRDQGRARQRSSPRTSSCCRPKTDALQAAFHKVSEQMYARGRAAAGAAGGNGAGADGAATDAAADEEEVVDAEVVDGEEQGASRCAATRTQDAVAARPRTSGRLATTPTSRGDEDPANEARRVEATERGRGGRALARAQRERDEYLDLARRTQADFENYRKRAARGGRGRGRARRAAGWSASCCRWWTTSSARCAAAGDGEQHLAEGVRLVHSELVACSSATASSSSTRRASRSTRPSTRRSPRARRTGAEPGVVLDVVEKGYRTNGTVLRPARVVVSG